MNLAIETRKLVRQFGDQTAVDHVDLQVTSGTFYGFLGPNGAGKSTTIKMLTGLLAPTSGAIGILGMNPFDPAQSLEIKRRIGVVPENLSLFDNLTAREYLTFVGRMFLLDRPVIEARSEELLTLMQLKDEEQKLTLEYSHGMQKKLALAGALLPNPDLLFLDEPFEGVDAVTSRVIREILAEFTSRGSTVFLTSHVLEIVEKLCSHVGIISEGKLMLQSSLDDLQTGNRSLEQCFLDTLGEANSPTQKLSWLDSNQNKNEIGGSVELPEEPAT